jgi:adenylate cyclase
MPDLDISLAGNGGSFSSLLLPEAYRAIGNLPVIASGASEGFFNVFPDPGGTVRKVPLFILMDGIPYPSLALEMVRLGRGQRQAVLFPASTGGQTLLGVGLGESFYPTDAQGQLNLNFRGPFATFPYLSAADILRGIGLDMVAGKYVLIGSSAAGIMDLVATPFAERLPGVEVQANAVDNLLRHDPLAWDNFTEIGLTYAILIVAGLTLLIALVRLGPLTGFSLAITVILAIVAGNYYLLFLRGQLLGISYILACLLTLLTTVTFCNYLFEGKRRIFVRRVFSRYVPPSVVNQLLKTPERLHLNAENREVTILFCDIRNFTSLAESTSPTELSSFLNTYFSLLTEIIARHRGMVDKYIGDAVMAVWGTPLDDPAHADNAVRAALEISAAIDHQGEMLTLAGRTISVGIGINSGIVSAGNFGSRDRFAYTVLGDAVNLAARLEGLTKFYQVRILATEKTRALAGEFPWRSIDIVRVKGRHLPVSLYQPLPGPAEPLAEAARRHEEAIAAYRQRRFAEAEVLFATLHRQHGGEELHRLYRQRCQAFQATPPASGWCGIHDHN